MPVDLAVVMQERERARRRALAEQARALMETNGRNVEALGLDPAWIAHATNRYHARLLAEFHEHEMAKVEGGRN